MPLATVSLTGPRLSSSLPARLVGAPDTFDPRSIPGLVLWLDATFGVALSVAPLTLTGTVGQSTNTLTGSGTKFLSECVIGDHITGAGGLDGVVTGIASDTSLTLDSSATVAGGTVATGTPVAGVSDRITSWADRSGRGFTASQATASKQPSRAQSAVNGLPVVRFDGGDDVLNSAIGSLAQPVSVVMVATGKGGSSTRRLLDGSSSSAGFLVDGSNTVYPTATTNVSHAGLGTSPVLLAEIFDGAASLGYKGSTAFGPENPGATGMTNVRLANRADGVTFLACDVGELIIWGGRDPSLLVSVLRYCGAKWNLAHP